MSAATAVKPATLAPTMNPPRPANQSWKRLRHHQPAIAESLYTYLHPFEFLNNFWGNAEAITTKVVKTCLTSAMKLFQDLFIENSLLDVSYVNQVKQNELMAFDEKAIF